MSALFSIINLKEDSVVVPSLGTIFPGRGIVNVELNGKLIDDIVAQGLSIISSDVPLGPPGLTGPSPWTLPSIWVANTNYTNVAPASVVIYDGNTYVCVVSHTSTNTFDGTKWIIVAYRGLTGLTGGIGNPGIQGPSPWAALQPWSSGNSYTNVAPASLVTYQNNIYLCNVAHTSSGTFDSTKWVLAVPQGGQGIQGNPGPSAWATPVAWSLGANYTNVAPASTVVYNSETYVCTIAHTSTSTFDTGKFIKVTAKGDTGTQGTQGVQGNIGNTGPSSWGVPAAWAASTAYTNVPPASVVIYQGSSYLCTVSHTSTSTFDSSKFTLIVTRGNTILYGTTAPIAANGIDGDFYIYDRSSINQSKVMYGPKAGGAWPGTFWIIQVYQIDDVPGLTSALSTITTNIANNTKQLQDIEFFGPYYRGG